MKNLILVIFTINIFFSQFEAKILSSEKQTIYTMKGEALTLEKNQLQVPNNRTNPTYSIIVTFYRVLTAAKKPGVPIFFLAGGPGDNGIPNAGSFWTIYAESFAEYSDVIFIDQRGTGKSIPNLQMEGTLDIPVELSMDDKQFWDFFANQMKQRVEKVSEEHDIDINDFNSFENANDIEDIRKALNYDKIILWGHSYGSHLGFAYINQFEDRVYKSMFTGVNGINDRYRLPSESNGVFDRMNSYIQGDAYYSKIIPDFKVLVREIILDLRKKPRMVNIPYRSAYNFNNQSFMKQVSLKIASLFTDSIAVKISEYEFKAFLMMTFQSTVNLYNLPEFVLEIKRGNYQRLAIMIKQFLNQGGKNSPATRNAMTYSMAISSHGSEEKLKAVKDEIENEDHFLTGVLNIPFMNSDLHRNLDISYLPDSFREERTYLAPILFINGDLDSRTTLERLDKIAEHFPNASKFIVQNASHTFYPLDDRIMQVMTEFISNQELSYSRIKVKRKFNTYAEQVHRNKLSELYRQNKIDEFKDYARAHKNELTEFSLNIIGYSYMQQAEMKKALPIFELNVELFSDYSNPYDSLAEAYFRLEEFVLAKKYYRKSIELNKMNRNAYIFLKRIENNKE